MAEYIERESLLKRLEAHQATNAWTIGKKQFAEGYYLGLSEAEIMIAQAQKADVAPVRRGGWFDVGSMSCRCSECGCKNARETPWCPNCGARMGGGSDNG